MRTGRLTVSRQHGTPHLLARNILGVACIPAAIAAWNVTGWFWLAIPVLWITDCAIVSHSKKTQASPR